MAIKYEKIQPGMVLYDRHRIRMGNTTMTRLGEWPVHVKMLVAPDAAFVSWNGNPPSMWTRKRLEKLYDWSMHDTTECRMVHGRPVRLTKAEREAARRV